MANILTFANQVITDTNIFGGISYLCDLNTGEEFSIGNTASACVSFVTDTQIPLYTKDQTNGVFTWEQDGTPRGTYYVTEVTKVNSSRYSVTAYDAMILLDTSIVALSLVFPLTVSAAASAIAAYLGCSTSGTIYNGTQTAQDGTIDDTVSIRKLLGWVAEASGASVKIDASGDIAFLYYASSGITVTSADYVEDGLDVADYTCAAIDNVTICDMAGMTAATAGSGDNSLFIQGNPFLYDAADTEAAVILSLVEDFEYAPFTCQMFEENGLDVGVTATFGTVTTLVMHLESSDSGAIASAVGSDSRAELNKSLEIIVNEALAVASDAQQTAQDLNLHFWYTAAGSEAGAHIAEVDKPTFESNPSGGNLLSSSSGIAVRDGLTELATFGADGAQIGQDGKSHIEMDYHSLQLIDKEGNTYFHAFDLRTNRYDETVEETFTGDGATKQFYLNYEAKSLVSATDSSDQTNIGALFNTFVVEFPNAPAVGATVTVIYTADISEAELEEVFIGNGSTTSFSPIFYVKKLISATDSSDPTNIGSFDPELGSRVNFPRPPADGATVTITYMADSEYLKAYTFGFRANSASSHIGALSVAEGFYTEASGTFSHAEGEVTKASGDRSHAEGAHTIASGTYSHAECSETTASGDYSHAEGAYTTASGETSHAEGWHTEASGQSSHAEGFYTEASGYASHAGGYNTIADSPYQTAIGKYNDNDSSNAFEIGNGQSNSRRSNALEVTWDGNVEIFLDTTAVSGIDHDIYAALVALGWDSDVIV